MSPDSSEILAVLKENPYLSKLELVCLEELAQIAEYKKYHANQVVFSLEQKGKYFYLVHTGKFLLRLRDHRTKEYKRGELFGEVALFTNQHRTGTMLAVEESVLLGFPKSALLDPQLVSFQTAVSTGQALTCKIISYLNPGKLICSEELINAGESSTVEFKESLSKSMKHTILKTLSGFMNADGGTVLIGVNDQKEVIGVPEFASYEVRDKQNQSLMGMISTYLGKYYTHLVSLDFEEISQKVILRLDCNSSPGPVFYRDNQGEEHFYIRAGATTQHITQHSEVLRYITRHFEKSFHDAFTSP